MASNWIKQKSWSSEDECLDAIPDDWEARQVESIYTQQDIGRRYDKKSTKSAGATPVVDQSADGFIGWHDSEPGVVATAEDPVVTFANHTCEMRLVRHPFSVIQNVFPLKGKIDDCDTRYFYYSTKGIVHLEEYKGHYPQFRERWIGLPPLSEQKAIGNILGTLDDKIELNRKTNETFEAMAKALFKSWFVDFDPIRAKAEGRPTGLPAEISDLFPDSFEDSELGEIPSGWCIDSIYAVASVVYGAPFSSSLFNGDGSGIPVARIRDLPGESPGVYTTEVHTKGTLILPGDIVVGMDGEFRAYLWGGEECWMNQRVCKFIPGKKGRTCFVRESIRKPLLDVEMSETATTVIHLGKGDIDGFRVVVPTQEILDIFSAATTPLYEEVVANKQQTRVLANIRDALLPKLISGEIRIPDAEKMLEEVGV
jgi:type I restriction enzyme S subunit